MTRTYSNKTSMSQNIIEWNTKERPSWTTNTETQYVWYRTRIAYDRTQSQVGFRKSQQTVFWELNAPEKEVHPPVQVLPTNPGNGSLKSNNIWYACPHRNFTNGGWTGKKNYQRKIYMYICINSLMSNNCQLLI